LVLALVLVLASVLGQAPVQVPEPVLRHQAQELYHCHVLEW
jgi:hypothetical protein